MIKIIHIFEHNDFHKNIDSVILKTIEYENKHNDVKSKVFNTFNLSKDDVFKELSSLIIEFKPSFVVFHSLYKTNYLYCSIMLKRNNIIYYIRPHGSFAKNVFWKNPIKKIFINLTFYYMIYNAAGYLFLNSKEKNNSLFKKKNCFLLPNNIEQSLKISFDEKFFLVNKKNVITISYIGKIDWYYKNIVFMLDTINKVKNENIEFKIYGPINKEDEKKFKSLINNPKINYCGSVYGEEKDLVYKNTDILLLLSTSEGMPMVILEALAKGCACFVTENTNMLEELINNNAGNGGKIDSDLFHSLSKFIDDYANNKVKYIQGSLNLANKYIFDIDNLYSTYLKMSNETI